MQTYSICVYNIKLYHIKCIFVKCVPYINDILLKTAKYVR